MYEKCGNELKENQPEYLLYIMPCWKDDQSILGSDVLWETYRRGADVHILVHHYLVRHCPEVDGAVDGPRAGTGAQVTGVHPEAHVREHFLVVVVELQLLHVVS